MPTLNWRPGCTSPYESAWSIIHKLAYLNRATAQDLKLVLCDRPPGAKSSHWPKQGSLNTFGKVDLRRLQAITGIEPRQLRDATVEPYLPAIGEFSSLVYAQPLRFCPECIARGYHSPLHQLPWLRQCLLHKTALAVACPSCGVEIPFALMPHTLANPYGCRCGHILWPARKEPTWLAPLTRQEVGAFGDYLQWRTEWERSVHGRHCALGFAVNTWNARNSRCNRHLVRVPRYWADLLPPPGSLRGVLHTREGEVHFTAEAGAGIRIASSGVRESHGRARFPAIVSEEDCTNKELAAAIQSVRAVYKSIRRYLCRTLVSHCHCIIEQKHLLKLTRFNRIHVICPWSFALAFWSNYWASELWPRSRTCSLSFYKIEHLLSELRRDERMAKSADSDGRRCAFRQWVTTRVYAQCLLGMFGEIVHLSQERYARSGDSSDIELGVAELPYFLVDMSLSDKSCFLHWWARPILEPTRIGAAASASHRARTVVLATMYRSAYGKYIVDQTRLLSAGSTANTRCKSESADSWDPRSE